jgi:ABC-2 type transport system permease protein
VIGVELVKLLRRARTWISVVLTCALPFVVAIFITITHLTPPPGQGSAFLSAVLANGALYPAAALALVMPVFLPVAVAVVAGDSIAGEASTGTLRYLLARPVGRTRLLVASLRRAGRPAVPVAWPDPGWPARRPPRDRPRAAP